MSSLLGELFQQTHGAHDLEVSMKTVGCKLISKTAEGKLIPKKAGGKLILKICCPI